MKDCHIISSWYKTLDNFLFLKLYLSQSHYDNLHDVKGINLGYVHWLHSKGAIFSKLFKLEKTNYSNQYQRGKTDIGRIHLPHLQINKYFTDDSSINFHDNFFLPLLLNYSKKWRKIMSWKFMDESSLKYLWICKYFRGDSSINFHEKVFEKIGKK